MVRILNGILLLTLVTGCGLRTGPPTPAPSVIQRTRLMTGLEAIKAARRAVPEASAVSRVEVSLARGGGTAEYWSILFYDSTSSTSYRRVGVEGREVVETVPADPPIAAGVPVGFEVIRVDTSAAEKRVRQLDWGNPSINVLLDSSAFEIGGPDATVGRRGRATWHFQVAGSGGTAPNTLGQVWVSVETGEIVDTERTQR